jgi:hypothetical protein
MKISGLTACFRNQQAPMTRRTMKHTIFIGTDRVVVGAYRIAGT